MGDYKSPLGSRARAEEEALEKAAEAIGRTIGPTLWPGHCMPAAKAAVAAFMDHMTEWTEQRRAFDKAILKAQEERVNDALNRATQPKS